MHIIAMKKEYKLGELSFKTKKACEEHVRTVINDIGHGCIESNHPQWDFFNILINNHPEKEFKIGEGVAYFWIQKNPIGNGLATMIKRTDGSIADFSWRYCCEFKPRTIIEDVTKAMRHSISPEIKKFKQTFDHKFKCAMCNHSGTKSQDFHADHVYPFSRIKDEFLLQEKENATPIPDRVASMNIGATQFHKEDNAFEKRWMDFHNKRSQLQILCASCNLNKSDKFKLDIADVFSSGQGSPA